LALVVNEGSGSMTGIATSTGATSTAATVTVQVGGQPTPAAVSPDGKTLVVGVSKEDTPKPGYVIIYPVIPVHGTETDPPCPLIPYMPVYPYNRIPGC
jgi:hypothetical protein